MLDRIPQQTGSPRTTRRVLPTAAFAGAALALAFAGQALAAEAGASGAPSEIIFIGQILALLLVGRLFGEAMLRVGQPAVMGQLIGGLVLGPSVLGMVWPEGERTLFPTGGAQKSMIDAVSQLGVLLLLLLTGMETDLALVKRVKRAAAYVSVTGIVLPFTCGALLGWYLPESMLPNPGQRLVTALFLGTALSISSVKIVASVVREMNFLRRDIGQVIVGSAIIDDTIGWMIIAVTFGIAQHGTIDLPSLAKAVLGTLAFMAFSLTLGRRIVARVIRWTNDNFISEVPVITAILIIMCAMAATTHFIGVHSVLGAFVAGVLVGDSPILTKHIEAELRGLVTALFMPVFFGLSGLQANLTILANPTLFLLTIGLILIASIGKFSGAFLGAGLAGMSRQEGFALAAGMNARGSTEVIVATIGLSMGVLSHDLFTMIVAMAVITTMAMPPMLRAALARLPMSDEERRRLAREGGEAKSFLPNLERLLVAIDASATGRFAARLAGMVAGSRGMPTTVLELAPNVDPLGITSSEDTVRGAALASRAPRSGEVETEEVEVLTRVRIAATDNIVAEEARKGYDLLLVGMEPTYDLSSERFGNEIVHTAAVFGGALGVVVCRGLHAADPLGGRLSILVPVNGTEASRRAAEVAITLARAADAPITAVTVARTVQADAQTGTPRERRKSARQTERAILAEVEMLADRHDTPIRTAVRLKGSPEEAILRQARRGSYSLIVIGVTRRPGEDLFFGSVSAALLERAGQSILLVAT